MNYLPAYEVSLVCCGAYRGIHVIDKKNPAILKTDLLMPNRFFIFNNITKRIGLWSMGNCVGEAYIMFIHTARPRCDSIVDDLLAGCGGLRPLRCDSIADDLLGDC